MGTPMTMRPEHGWQVVRTQPGSARAAPEGEARAGAAAGRAEPARPPVRFGPLEQLAQDRGVTDIVVTCDGAVWVDRGRGMQLAHTAIPLHDPHVLRDFAVRLCAQLGCRLDAARPIADASAADGTRVHAVIAPIVPQGASVSIRFPDRVAPDLDVLAANGMCPAAWVPLLRTLVRRRANVLITGGTGVGKTTLLKAMLACCGPAERIVTVEEVRELNAVPHGHTVSLVAREANVEGSGAVGLAELVKATLRMRPDRVVVGECRGEEVVDLLRALNSGHRGSFTTVHADGVERVPGRLVSLGLLAGLEPRATTMLAQGAFDVLLHLERGATGRRIAQIGTLECDDGRLRSRLAAQWDGVGRISTGEAWESFAARWPGLGTAA